MAHFNEIEVTEQEVTVMMSRYNVPRDTAITMAQLRREKQQIAEMEECMPAKQIIDTSDGPEDGCPHCGSYEGDWQECPECGHGQ